MSGDVQPRKRKDKKKKRESLDVRKSEGELIFSRKSSLQDDEASHGVHVTKMGSDDVLLHVHEEHGTGGNWCAKIIFFSLMTILMGLVCLIILENRGISDVDTPLSESRFSNYFDGWVDEHRNEHDSHHGSQGSVEDDAHDDEHDDHDDEHDDHDDDEDDHDEPFEEEADHSEGDEDVAEEEDDNVTPEEEDEDGDNATAENVTAEEDGEEDEEDDGDGVEDVNVTAEEVDDDNVTAEDENEATVEQEDDNEDDDDNDGDNKTNEDDEDDNTTKETSKPTSQGTHDDGDDAFDDEEDDDDDDGTLDSLERIVDNDGAELELLKEKARQQEAAESKQNVGSDENEPDDEANNAPSWASSQIKPKTGGGPQSLEDDEVDLFERDLRKANDEMMREFNYH